MSQDIVSIRRQIKQVSSLLRQGKIMLAAQAVQSVLRVMLTTPLMKAEKDEFIALIREAIDYLNNDQPLRKLYPLALMYTPGEEKKLFDDINELLDMLNEEKMTEVNALAKVMEEKKQAALDKGQGHLDAEEYDQARAVYHEITTEFPHDSELKGAIGEQMLGAGLYEDAAKHLGDAVTLDPNALNLYNRLGIALRKLSRFDVAEEYYMKALPLAPEDPYLLFNIGRLYAEWGKWDKALEYGEKAHAIKPDFEEARKLAAFSRKKL
jgi:Flp pilus assembly protein TadD, contains TPR repeats